jgi:5-hydroxyisourate hydrolase
VRVTGPFEGFHRYEYALHNRDNRRGVGALRIPVCPGARVRALGSRDGDGDPAGDWSATVGASEIVFATASDPLRWNSLDNFWFECDAAPAPALLGLDAFDPGPGASALGLELSAPLRLANAFLGAGCALGTPPTLFAEGDPARAEIGYATFALVSTGNAPLQPHGLRMGLVTGSTVLGGCTIWIGPSLTQVVTTSAVLSDVTGRPAEGIRIELWRLDGKPTLLKAVTTNADGRTDGPLLGPEEMHTGTSELLFFVKDYFVTHHRDSPFLDRVPVRFAIADPAAAYHVPLVVTPWAYSTYRGS